MSQKTIFILVMLLILCGCGRKVTPELQSFEGVTVATLQTPFSLMDDASLTGTALSIPGSAETPPPTALEPTHAPGDVVGTGVNPTQTSVNPSQVAGTQLTPFSTATPQSTLTPPPPGGNPTWEGTWNIWYQNSTGAYSSSVLSLQVSDGQFSATANINSEEYTFKGDFNQAGDEANGKWKTTRADGEFWWQLISSTTFIGSREDRFGFCGDRVSTDRPGSCRKLPPN